MIWLKTKKNIELKIHNYIIYKKKMLISWIEWNESLAFLIKNNETFKKLIIVIISSCSKNYCVPMHYIIWSLI